MNTDTFRSRGGLRGISLGIPGTYCSLAWKGGGGRRKEGESERGGKRGD